MSRVDAPTGAWAMDVEPVRDGFAGRGLLTAFAGVVMLWPFVPVIHAGPWSLILVMVIVVVAGTGIAARMLMARRSVSARELTALAAQFTASALVMTAMLLPQTAVFGMIPTATTVRAFGDLVLQAAGEVYNGAAPLDDTLALRTVLAVLFAAVLILVDQLIACRLALLAALVVTSVGALPTIITFGDADVVWFIALAALVLLLLRSSDRRDRRSARRTSTAFAAGVGVSAIALTVIVAPVLPVSATWTPPGTGVTVDASLRLGDDLRRPNPTQVLSLATTSETAPYLRLATLSQFTGEIWRPDRSDTLPLSSGFGEPDWDEELTGVDRRTSIRVLGLSSDRLPVPYPAERIVGVSSGWEVMTSNRTVLSDVADAAGRDYTVTSALVQPTFEQITASRASAAEAEDLSELPPIIAQTALEVTAGLNSDYEKLVALQNWFRSEFEYSVDAPVEEDFDGTGAGAVATFLEVRSGYCVHFAGSFALMAKTLGMQARVVVGYLPGSLTEEKRGDEFIYSVMSDQLHAWPEVRFDGIGWVPFEPTATLGIPTAFARAAIDGGGVSGDDQTAGPSAAPSAAPTAGPDIAREDTPGTTGGQTALQRLDPVPVVLVGAGIVVVLLLPFLVRSFRRGVRMRRAQVGDASAAWLELRDTMVDLGLPVSDAQSPRERAAALSTDNGVDAAALAALVSGIEQASYARTPLDAGSLDETLSEVLHQLRASLDGRARLKARFLPRSLFAQRPAPSPVTV